MADAEVPLSDLVSQVQKEVQMLSRGSISVVGGPDGPEKSLDRAVLKSSIHALAELCRTEANADLVVSEGGIEVLVPLLSTTLGLHERSDDTNKPEPPSSSRQIDEDIVKETCFTLGRLAVKQDYQNRIAHFGAIPRLVALFQQVSAMGRAATPGTFGVARRACDAITNMAHENLTIKQRVKDQGGIPPLVELLDCPDVKVQRGAAGALRTLAFKNEDNKQQIVECGALPTLVQMLRSEDSSTHCEAVGVIGNLVHSSQPIKKQVLDTGALQPVIGLLSTDCQDSQREAALLIGQFATVDPDYKVKIVQRGAVPPLIRMLGHSDKALKEMAAFAIGRLAQNADNQAGIVHAQGLRPLLDLLDAGVQNLQHNAAFALYGLADNEDNVPDMIKEGAVQRLRSCEFKAQQSRDCVQKTMKRLEDKMTGQVLRHTVYLMRYGSRKVEEHIACALAHLVHDKSLHWVFVQQEALEVLIQMITVPGGAEGEPAQREAAEALLQLWNKVRHPSAKDCAPAIPGRQVYLGAQYVNSEELSDVTFVVAGRPFYAHKIAMSASSDAFQAMFSQAYREHRSQHIDIPNIPWEVWECMMRFVYTGHVDVPPALAESLLLAADQYLLEGLKHLCETIIAQGIDCDTLVALRATAERYSAPTLARRCLLFALEKHEDVRKAVGGVGPYSELLQKMSGDLRLAITHQLELMRDSMDETPAGVEEDPPAPAVPDET